MTWIFLWGRWHEEAQGPGPYRILGLEPRLVRTRTRIEATKGRGEGGVLAKGQWTHMGPGAKLQPKLKISHFKRQILVSASDGILVTFVRTHWPIFMYLLWNFTSLDTYSLSFLLNTRAERFFCIFLRRMRGYLVAYRLNCPNKVTNKKSLSIFCWLIPTHNKQTKRLDDITSLAHVIREINFTCNSI